MFNPPLVLRFGFLNSIYICSIIYQTNELSGEQLTFYRETGYVTVSLSDSAPLSLKTNEVNKDVGDQWLLAKHTWFREPERVV